jgi:hypothetical protein
MSRMTLRVAEQFSSTPGSRYESEGDFSGEVFRRDVLLPRLRDAIASHRRLLIDLDGTAGYGTSFLEEAFGGLVRENHVSAAQLRAVLDLKSDEEDYLVEDIWAYIDDAEGSSK